MTHTLVKNDDVDGFLLHHWTMGTERMTHILNTDDTFHSNYDIATKSTYFKLGNEFAVSTVSHFQEDSAKSFFKLIVEVMMQMLITLVL